MNKQGKVVNGQVVGGIEWVKTFNADGTQTQGYTSGVIGGCPHGCRWEMPDGTIAECYAETVAENVASSAYPNGFEAHYWRPGEMQKWHSIKEPKRIFMGSMTDWMNIHVSDDEIFAVLHNMRLAKQHTFMTLTKAAPRLLAFADEIRSIPNLWVGVSVPPTFMFGKRLTDNQRTRMMNRQLDVLGELKPAIAWMSIEPLSSDVAPLLEDKHLDWIVIGAASAGRQYFQPKPEWVMNLHRWADRKGISVFHKGNLTPNGFFRREEYPVQTGE